MRFVASLSLAFLLLQHPGGPTGAPLPANYTVVMDNAEVQVQRVHYGPHETVPMHDHPAVSTVYVYLSDDQGFDVKHETGFTVHRPPAHVGALRISPGAFERHAVANTSDVASDFLRIELKQIPVKGLAAEARVKAPQEDDARGLSTVYSSPKLRIERLLCGGTVACELAAGNADAVVVDIPLGRADASGAQVDWLPKGRDMMFGHHSKGQWEILRVMLL